ncbi:MAG: hypothetical protein ACI976_001167, partial [Aureispira sp.]
MKISIPKPCSKDWNQMTPSEKGRFCTSCQTQVVHFTERPVEEIKHFLEQKTESICGRLSRHQIETFNAAYQELPSPSILKKWTMAAVLAGVSALPTFAQNSNPPILPAPLLHTSIPYYQNQPQRTETVASDTVVLTGKVIDAKINEGIIAALIVVKGTKIGALTDIDGNFRLVVPKSNEAIILEIHYTGYSAFFHSIVPDGTKTGLILEMSGLDFTTIEIVGMIVVSKKEQRTYKRTRK